MKCKVINAIITDLEEYTNDWLKTGKYEIISVTQTHDIYITLTIFYLDKNEIRTKKLENLNNINK